MSVRAGSTLAALLDPRARVVIAHRGASGHAPENTMEAFRLALSSGADALELDTHLTADGVAVVIHDATLNRTTDLSGAIASLTYDEIRKADAGFRFTTDGGVTFPYRGSGVYVPTLEEVARNFESCALVLEIKTAAAQKEALRVLASVGARERTIVSSADLSAVTEFRAAGWTTGACASEAARLKFDPRSRGQLAYRALFVPLRHRGLPIPTRGFVRAAARGGATVHVWTVNETRIGVRLWRRGCVGIITNFPGEMVSARAEAGLSIA
jgi:glycerophosphoryl diester phosphodiesterase